MVQKIGFLLGDGAAKVEKMLNSIVQTYANERNEEQHLPGDDGYIYTGDNTVRTVQ